MVNTAVFDCEISSDTVVAQINIMQKVLESCLTVKHWNEIFQAAQDNAEQMKTVETKEKEVVLAITNVLENIC